MHVTDIWRHPIKSHGREAIETVELKASETMPFDRVWAVAHEASKVDWDNPVWASCGNFSRGSKAPSLMAINAVCDEGSGAITLTHPDRPTQTFDLNRSEDADALIDWVRPICPENRAQPKRVYSVKGRGLTDSDFPSISINSHASLRDLSEKAGVPVSDLRFRGNFWVDDLEPWAELDWVGKELQLGTARIRVIERTERCSATTANPETGVVDLDTLHHLKSNWGHLDFGVRAEVVSNGVVKLGDVVSL